MPVISASPLPAVSVLNPRYTVCAMIVTMFAGRYCKHDWWGFVQIYAGFLAYHLIVMLGADVQNPLDLYTLVDYTDASRILNIIDPVLCFFFCWIGFVFQKILSNIQLLQLTEKIPYFLRSQEKPELLILPDGTHTVRNIVHDRNAPDRNFGVVGLTQSWWQSIVTFITFLALITPQVVYDYYANRTGQQQWAFGVLVGVSTGVLLVYTGYCYFFTDPGSFGLTATYLTANGDLYNLKPEDVTLINADTKKRVLWSILPIAAFAAFGYGVMAGWRLVDPDADRQWLGAVGLWGFYALILVVIVISMSPSGNPFMMPAKSTRMIDDSQGYVEQLASRNSGGAGMSVSTAAGSTTISMPSFVGNNGVMQRFASSSVGGRTATTTDKSIEMQQLVSGGGTRAPITQHGEHW